MGRYSISYPEWKPWLEPCRSSGAFGSSSPVGPRLGIAGLSRFSRVKLLINEQDEAQHGFVKVDHMAVRVLDQPSNFSLRPATRLFVAMILQTFTKMFPPQSELMAVPTKRRPANRNTGLACQFVDHLTRLIGERCNQITLVLLLTIGVPPDRGRSSNPPIPCSLN